MITGDTKIENVPRVHKRIVPQLKRLGILTVKDLLFHFPFRYDDFSRMKAISGIAEGDTVTIRGTVEKITMFRTAKKGLAMTEATISDASGSIKAVWFNQPYLLKTIKQGLAYNFSGKISVYKGKLSLQSPAHEKANDDNDGRGTKDSIHTGRLTPVYPETRGITSRWLRFLISSFMPMSEHLQDPLPSDIRTTYDLLPLREAILAIHFPRNLQDVAASKRRFGFEDLLLIQLNVLRERLLLGTSRAPMIPRDIALVKSYVESLPFALTDAQRRSIWEIITDLEKGTPMNRMLEGDVGSGKTVVAAAACLVAAHAGWQVAFLAPTEIVALQHFETMKRLLSPFGIRVRLATGAKKSGHQDAMVAVGTHALLYQQHRFERLGLVMVDEQHRFGVEQRAALLKNKSYVPHFLSMTATPIPRTLALTIYGDLDISLLDQMPANRKKVITIVVDGSRRNESYRFIRDEVGKGRQVFVICPRIEEEKEASGAAVLSQRSIWQVELKTVAQEYKKLSEEVFPDLRVLMLHGRMKPKEKERIMDKFRQGETDILVSTSVIEVGVDIPNATIMMIEGAEQFGLAQLHQFRGRVGRGTDQSYCFLFPSEDGMGMDRLRTVAKSSDGFELAEKDLLLRGPGDLLGTSQWGDMKGLASALANPVLVREVREAARVILQRSRDLNMYPVLRARLDEIKRMAHRE